ncbi:NTF2 fold immunity protein [Duganella callida]|nr:NTF2 fold immunity protein [Duganella callida]
MLMTLFVVWAASALAQRSEPHNYKPEVGYVPDAATAIRIAVAVWGPIYGEKIIAAEAPFRAVLKDNVWTVEGFLPKGHVGGVAIAEISKKDATILRISHGK